MARAEGFQGLGNGGGMMPKIIDDSDAGDHAANIHAALDAFEGIESGLDLFI